MGESGEVLREYGDFFCDGSGGRWVVTCEHVDFDAGGFAFSYGVFGFETRWVVEGG